MPFSLHLKEKAKTKAEKERTGRTASKDDILFLHPSLFLSYLHSDLNTLPSFSHESGKPHNKPTSIITVPINSFDPIYPIQASRAKAHSCPAGTKTKPTTTRKPDRKTRRTERHGGRHDETKQDTHHRNTTGDKFKCKQRKEAQAV